MQWSFNRTSDAPWLNGACESLIRSIKRSLQRAIGDAVLTFSEFQTVLYEVAAVINRRPIGIKPGNTIEYGSYLCPNDLLLGRNSRYAPNGPWTADDNPRKRLQFMNMIVESF